MRAVGVSRVVRSRTSAAQADTPDRQPSRSAPSPSPQAPSEPLSASSSKIAFVPLANDAVRARDLVTIVICALAGLLAMQYANELQFEDAFRIALDPAYYANKFYPLESERLYVWHERPELVV